MLLRKRSIALATLALLVPLASCSNGSFGQSLQRSLGADPQLQDNPSSLGALGGTLAEVECDADAIAALPDGFPTEFCYPNGDVISVEETRSSTPANADFDADADADADAATTDADATDADAEPQPIQVQWSTTDAISQVLEFYTVRFESEGWEITERPDTADDGSGDDAVEAVSEGVRVRIAAASADDSPSANPEPDSPADADDASSDLTRFSVDYRPSRFASRNVQSISQSDADFPAAPDDEVSNRSADRSGNRSEQTSSSRAIASEPQSFTDLDEAPEELQPYVQDLAQLGVLSAASDAETSKSEFNPNEPITRRTFARWLFATNNELYRDRPSNRIRSATNASQPAFQDVPRSDPDFEVIQGLAEAGLIPSPLSGDSTTVTFRPDAPLTREHLVLWKLPLDLRQTLPTATVEAVQQTWGFQDAARIDPKALRAVLADYQNGDQANIRRAFGYTTLFQPKKSVTRAEAAAALWFFGYQGEGLSADDVVQAAS